MLNSLLVFASLALAAVAAPSNPGDAIRIVYTFTDGAYPENIAIRSNGDLLINSLITGRVYTLNPTASKPEAHVLIQLAPEVANGFTGITEYAHDKFAVISGKFDVATITAKETAVWTFDAAAGGKGTNTTTITPKKVVDIPNPAGLPNGLTTLSSSRGILLAADAGLGSVLSIDIHRGVVRTVAQDNTLKITRPDGFPLGVNGIHPSKDGRHILFTNSNTLALNKVAVRPDGSFAGNVSVVAQIHGGAVDDFAIGRDGRIWAMGLPTFLNIVHPGGRVDVHDVFVNEANPGTGNPTAAAFGRGSKAQEKILYVVSSWGVVYAVDTTRF